MNTHWDYQKLGEVMDVKRGGSPRPINKYLTNDPNGLNWIKISDATSSNKYIYETKQKITADGLHKTRLVEEGDFLLSNSMSFGRPYIMKTSGCIHDGWLVLKNKGVTQIDSEFLYHALSAPNIFTQFDQLAAGSTVRNLNIGLVSSVKIPVPPLEEQKQIVVILDQAFAVIDQAQANIQKNIQNAQDLFQSKLNQIFSQQGEGWEEVVLSELIDISHGFAFKSKDFEVDFFGDNTIVLTPGNFSENSTLYFTEKNTKRCIGDYPESFKFNVGDLVVVMTDLSSKMKILGKPSFIDQEGILHNQRIGRVILKKNIIDKQYLYFFFQTKKYLDEIKSTSTGTMVRHTAPKRILATTINYPVSSDIQKKYTDLIYEIRAQRDDLVSRYNKKIEDLEELKKSFLQKAFNGELTKSKKINETKKLEMPELTANVIAFAYYYHEKQNKTKTYGHVKAQKILHLTESIVGLDLDREPYKDAAGPNDIYHMNAAENWAKKNNGFEFMQRPNGRGYDFKKLSGFDQLVANAQLSLEPYKEKLESLIQLLIPKKSQEVEVIATVHAAWNNMILDNIEITDERIIYEARDNWHPDKLKIDKHKFTKAIEFIRSNNFVPDGTAKRVTGKGGLF